MALVSRIPSISPSSGATQLRKIKSFGLKPVSCINYVSQSSSPFTEKHSIERYQRDNWIYKNELEEKSGSCPILPDPSYVRDYDIALQLPELKKMLRVLKEKRKSEGGGDKRGPGNVYLVGTGPGDPELLTLKALRVIQNADLLLYDRLVSNEVLDLVGPDARLLYVGKTAGYHSRTQVGAIPLWFLNIYTCVCLIY